jgi:hypothetical protein
MEQNTVIKKRLCLLQYISIMNKASNNKGDLVRWYYRLTTNVKVATVLGSIPASSDTVEYEGRQMKQIRIKYFLKYRKTPPLK